MNRKMETVEVKIGHDGNICITQSYNMGEEDTILINPSQVDFLIEWLKEAKAKCLEAKSD